MANSNTFVQPDSFSVFLAKYVIENQNKPPQLKENWATAELLLRHADLSVEASGSGERLAVAHGGVYPSVVRPDRTSKVVFAGSRKGCCSNVRKVKTKSPRTSRNLAPAPPGDVDMGSVQGFEVALQPHKDGFIVFWLIVPF